MPIMVELEPGSHCPYFSFCALDDLKALLDDNDAQIIDICVDTSTLTRFNHLSSVATTTTTASASANVARPEQFFFPSSIAFDFVVLFDNALLHANHLGLQRKVLTHISSSHRKA